MKIGVLTSSRADFGVYLPLLKAIQQDNFFSLEIIAFGTHLSRFYGYSLTEIENEKFKTIHTLPTMLLTDDAESISTAHSLTGLKFAEFWNSHKYDLVFCLGDRYEMHAAVIAGIPYGIKFAHIAGGETTLGAIDNMYRHQITIVAYLHFTAAKEYADKVKQLRGSSDNVYNIGSLSLDNINNLALKPEKVFRDEFNIPEGDFALVTFHPATISPERNRQYAYEIESALSQISAFLNLVITMPNADTSGTLFRDTFLKIRSELPDQFVLVENMGKVNYFSAMKYSKILIGNSSSGIVEAASFNKFVVNVGDRQKGRIQSDNIINCGFTSPEIIHAVTKASGKGKYTGRNIYSRKDVAKKIISILKDKKNA